MRERSWMSVSTLMPVAVVAAAVVPAAAPPQARAAAPPTVSVESRLMAGTAALTPPPGALIQQFLANQGENCSLICTFVVQGATQIPLSVVAAPQTFVTQVLAGQPLAQAAASAAATISGAVNDAWNGIIVNDVDEVIPRARYGTEVLAVGLADIAETALMHPDQLPQAIQDARSDLLAALSRPPGATPPATAHDAVGAAAVRVLEVGWAAAFQGPERFLLGFTQAPNEFLTTFAASGDVALALQAAGMSISTTIAESLAPIEKSLAVSIPVTPKAAATTAARQDTAKPGAVRRSSEWQAATSRTPAAEPPESPLRRSTETKRSNRPVHDLVSVNGIRGNTLRERSTTDSTAGHAKASALSRPAGSDREHATSDSGGDHHRTGKARSGAKQP